MKFTPKSIKKFQEGGPMEGPEAMPAEAPAPQGDPLMMLAEMAAQALQAQDCNAMAQVCEALLQLLQQAGPQEPAGEPVFRKGGILARRIKK